MRFLLKMFGEESAVGRFLNRLYIVTVSNLLFVLFCVPVVTIGASISAKERLNAVSRSSDTFDSMMDMRMSW